jgi:hypothetical protein
MDAAYEVQVVQPDNILEALMDAAYEMPVVQPDDVSEAGRESCGKSG